MAMTGWTRATAAIADMTTIGRTPNMAAIMPIVITADSPRYRERRLARNDRIYRGQDGRYYCRRSDGTTGLLVGAAVGGLLGNIIAPGGSKTLGTLLGAAGGGVAGASIDADNTALPVIDAGRARLDRARIRRVPPSPSPRPRGIKVRSGPSPWGRRSREEQ